MRKPKTKTDGIEKLGKLVEGLTRTETNLMCQCIFDEQDRARAEGRLSTRQNVINDFKARSTSNLPDAKVDDLFQFISELYEQTKN